MEWFLSLFILHDTLVVSLLVVGITIVVVLLLLFSQKSPESVVKSELGSNENVEGALRRVLGEQRWLQSGASGGNVPADGQKVDELEMEVLEKDRKIAELNKQLTQTGSGGEKTGDGGESDSDLLERLAELEARLTEYEIIEDDIADLSLYKTENEKLKNEIDKLKAKIGNGEPAVEVIEEPVEAPTEEPAEVSVEPVEPEEDIANEVEVAEEKEEPEGVDGADLVAEFEKVVNSQVELATDESSSKVSIKGDGDTGKVLMAETNEKSNTNMEVAPQNNNESSVSVAPEPIPIHPKLKDVNPDSKEEAEVFISELKSLKNIKKTSEES